MCFLDASLATGHNPETIQASVIDALTHAIEAATGSKSNEHSIFYGMKAINIIRHNFHKIYKNPNDLDCIGRLLEAATYAGIAFDKSPVGGFHIFSKALDTEFSIAHGIFNALVMKAVLNFNISKCDEKTLDAFIEIAKIFGTVDDTKTKLNQGLQLIEFLKTFYTDAPVNLKLSDYTKHDISDEPELVKKVAKVAMKQERLLPNSPVNISPDDANKIVFKIFQ